MISEAFTIQLPLTIDFSLGFSSAHNTMTFNGNTVLDDTRLQMTDGFANEISSAFVTAPANVQQFTTDFTFQLSNPLSEGITFTIQGVGPTALGAHYSGLGYEGILKSVAIKFDLYSNQTEGPDSTGLYINGAYPTIPSIDLSNTGINLHSDDDMDAHITYDGTTLILTITDIVTNAVWSHSFPINIPAIVGADTAYVGFTGSSGPSLSASQKILAWTYQVGPPSVGGAPPIPNYPAGVGFSAAGLTLNGATLLGNTLQLTDGGPSETRTAYFSTPVTTNKFITDFDFQITNPKGGGFTFIVQNAGLGAIGLAGGSGLGSHEMPTSVAVKFDIYSNAGEGNDSTGIYLNGASPTVPATDLTASGVVLGSGDVIHAHMVYDGTNLTLTLSDASKSASVTEVYPVNIPQVVGGSTAYVGFTAATGTNSAIQNVLDWTFNEQ